MPTRFEIRIDGIPDPVIVEVPKAPDGAHVLISNADTGQDLVGVNLAGDRVTVGHWPDQEQWAPVLTLDPTTPS